MVSNQKVIVSDYLCMSSPVATSTLFSRKRQNPIWRLTTTTRLPLEVREIYLDWAQSSIDSVIVTISLQQMGNMTQAFSGVAPTKPCSKRVWITSSPELILWRLLWKSPKVSWPLNARRIRIDCDLSFPQKGKFRCSLPTINSRHCCLSLTTNHTMLNMSASGPKR